MLFEEWSDSAQVTSPTLQVGSSASGQSRSFWNMLGIPVFEDDVLPSNWYKKPKAWCTVDLQIKTGTELSKLAREHGAKMVGCPYGELGYCHPEFRRTEEEYDKGELNAHMRRAFNFIKAYKESHG